jgi:hypothetical protein
MQRLLSSAAKAAGVESFLVFLSRGPDASISRPLLLDTLQSLLSHFDLSIETRLRLRYYPASFFSGEELVPVYKRFYPPLPDALGPEDWLYVFPMAVFDHLFSAAFPKFVESKKVNVAAIKFVKSTSPEGFRKCLVDNLTRPAVAAANMFFASRFAWPDVISVLFKPVSAQFRSAQGNSLVWFLQHNKRPADKVTLLFPLLNASDFGLFNIIFDADSLLFCGSFIHFAEYPVYADRVTAIVHFFNSKKVLTVFGADGIENAVLALAAHYFTLENVNQDLAALIE